MTRLPHSSDELTSATQTLARIDTLWIEEQESQLALRELPARTFLTCCRRLDAHFWEVRANPRGHRLEYRRRSCPWRGVT